MVKYRMFLFQKNKTKLFFFKLTRDAEILTATDVTSLKKGQEEFFEV